MAYLDHLTGLRNRRYFEERFQEELSRSKRTGAPCSVLVADVNDFKQINDTHGHAAGDLVLRRVGELLTRNQRVTDIACRIGGDEFAIILPDTTLEGARALVERLENGQPEFLDPAHLEHGLKVRISFGTATFPGEATSKDALLQHADRMMYAHKRARKDSGVDRVSAA
jgi:diguanylate cyclase (GGDEF)-like protein